MNTIVSAVFGRQVEAFAYLWMDATGFAHVRVNGREEFLNLSKPFTSTRDGVRLTVKKDLQNIANGAGGACGECPVCRDVQMVPLIIEFDSRRKVDAAFVAHGGNAMWDKEEGPRSVDALHAKRSLDSGSPKQSYKQTGLGSTIPVTMLQRVTYRHCPIFKDGILDFIANPIECRDRIGLFQTSIFYAQANRGSRLQFLGQGKQLGIGVVTEEIEIVVDRHIGDGNA